MDLMEQQRQQFQVAMREKKDARDLRIYQSMENNQEIERKRRTDFEERQAQSALREERLMQQRALEQEESAKKSFQTMMRRKMIQDEASRKAEERRDCIIEQQEDTECRLLEHEQKKERYLDFKRELDGLRLKNKEINVERQRRKEEAKREDTAEQVRRKDEKMEWLVSERNRLWQIRRATQNEAYRARELVKNEIMRQRVASKFNSKDLAKHVGAHLEHDLFTPKILQTTASMPLLKSMNEHVQQQQAAMEDVDIPEEYLDPVMADLMTDPVLLPSSQKIMDRKNIVRIIMSDDHDPFTRTPLKTEELIPQPELKAEIEAFAQKHNICLD